MVAEDSEAKARGSENHTMEEGRREIRGNRSMGGRTPRQERIKEAERWKMYNSGTEENPVRRAERRVTKKRYPEEAETEKQIEEWMISRKRYGEASQRSGWSQEETRRKETRKTSDTKILGRPSRETRQNDRAGQTREDKKHGSERSCKQMEGKTRKEKDSRKAEARGMDGTWRFHEWKNQKTSRRLEYDGMTEEESDGETRRNKKSICIAFGENM